ncbi:MAG: hypothetical protein U1G08_19975 [Verrucomicrobiota bacterium]
MKPTTNQRHSVAPLRWHGERETILRRLCSRLRERRLRGEPVTRAAGHLARPWRRRFYRSRPEKPVRVSPTLLLRKYYELENTCWSPETLRLRYRSYPRRTLPQELALEFLARCLTAPTDSGAEVYRGMLNDWKSGKGLPGVRPATDSDSRFPFSLSTFYRRVPGRRVRDLRARRSDLSAEEFSLRNAIAHHGN